MFDEGIGVPEDEETAMKWYGLAAAQGHADAQHNLGLLKQDYSDYLNFRNQIGSYPVFKLLPMLIFGVIVASLASRKNRNTVAWGIAGALSLVIALLVLAFKPYLCPICKREISNEDAKKGHCPNCESGTIAQSDFTS